MNLLLTPVQPLTPRQRAIAVSLAVFCALTRLLALSKSLWEWDEAQFVLAMRDYDVSMHHPHPPGFPLYVGAAKLVRLLVGDDFRALQSVNLLAAFLVFPALFLFARELRLRFGVAVSAAALFAFFPNVWFFGGTGFSDVPSVVLVLFAVTLLLRGVRGRGAYWAGTLLLALAIAIRPQNLLVGLVPGIVATVRRRPLEIVAALLIGVTVVGAAYGGAIAATGSREDYLRSVRGHADYISRVDSWRSEARPPLWRLWDRFFVKQYQQPALSILATLFVIASAVGSARERSRPMLLNVLTFAPFAVFAFLMLDRFSVSRFAVGYQPMFAILLSDGLRRAGGWIAARQGRWRAETAAAALVSGMIGGFGTFTVPALTTVRREVAPPVLAVQAVRTRVDPARERLYVGHSVSKFVDLYAPEVPYTRVIDDRALPLTEPARAWILGETTGIPLGGMVFRRQRGNLWNIARHQFFEIRLAPLERRARFVSGWGEPVVEGIHEWRAMGAHSVTLLPPARGTTKLRMHLHLPEELVAARARVTLRLNGLPLDSFHPATWAVERNYDVEPAPADAPNRLELFVDRTVIDDQYRPLGLRLRYLAWGPT